MKIKIDKKITILSTVFLSAAAVFLLINPANAVNGWAHILVGSLANAIVSVLGWVLIKLMAVFMYVAQYDKFIHSAAVTNGWIIARDVANMFFVVIMLVIAFATILNIESYNYKKWLPKLILMAILINFSKTICGLLIDVAQVIMLTFVNSFKDVAAGNLTQMLGISDWQSMQGMKEVGGWEVASAYILAVIYVIIALITIAAMVGMLVMRIIMIWIYVVLSPFAYLLAAFPGGQKYSSQWWGDFIKNLIVGPVLAFFIWLSFTSMVDLHDNSKFDGIDKFVSNNTGSGSVAGCKTNEKGVCEFGTSELMLKFIISIGMLLGGMKIAQEIGGAAGSVAGKIASKGKGLALAGAGFMGYNFAKRRLGAWKEEKKKNLQQKSDLFYEGVKGGFKGVASGLYRASGVKNIVDDNAFFQAIKDRREENRKKRAQTQARTEAFHDKEGTYKDADGKSYKYDESRNAYFDDKGNIARGMDGKAIEKMSGFRAVFRAGIADSMTKARALKNQINEEKMSKEQKILEGAGSSVNDLKRVLNNSAESRDKRMAAALQLAIKEGFKNKDLAAGRQEVAVAKSLIGNNVPMLKKFEDQINKRFAALNFDLATEGGKDAYKEAMADGSVNGYRQDASTYDENTIRVLEDYSGKDFAKNISDTMKESKDHRNNATLALATARNTDINSGDPDKALIKADGEINKFAKILARNGELFKAFNNTTNAEKVNFDATSESALVKFLETAKAEHASNINGDTLDPVKLEKILSKEGVDTSVTNIDQIVISMNKALARGVETSKLVSMERSDNNPEMVRRIMGAIDKYGKAAQKSEISNNNILKNIKPIAAI